MTTEIQQADAPTTSPQPVDQRASVSAPSLAGALPSKSTDTREYLHRRVTKAYRAMTAAESDGAYNSAKADFDEFSRRLADLGVQDIDKNSPNYVGDI